MGCYGSASATRLRYGLKKSLRRLCTRTSWGPSAAGPSFRTFVGSNAAAVAARDWAVCRPSMALDNQMSLLRLWMFLPRSCISWCSVTARRLRDGGGENGKSPERARLTLPSLATLLHTPVQSGPIQQLCHYYKNKSTHYWFC